MEFPDLGKNCQWKECKQNDFLPFQCNYCKSIYCKDHFFPDSHQCSSIVILNKSASNIKKNLSCTFKGCFTKDVVEMLCIKCTKHFCLTHRYHDCFQYSTEEIEQARQRLKVSREQYEESLTKINKKIDEDIEKAKKNSKKNSLALKVQLMRLKGKAVGPGNIPTEERVYFLIFTPRSLKMKSKAVYCCNSWSIGRAIDAFANLCNVPNHNNVAQAQKLRLFKKSDGLTLLSDMSVKLNSLIENGRLENGESLILEYVPPEAILDEFVLENLSSYVD